MSPIVPALIPTSFAHIEETLASITSFTHEIQIDIVDGVFVPFVSWPYGVGDRVEDLANYTQSCLIELDCMMMNPESVIEDYLRAGVRRVIVHLESTKNLSHILILKERYDFKLGLSILNDTPIDVLTDVINCADYIQLMGIAQIGSQGQPFDVRVITRIHDIKKAYPNLLISIDGSVNSETVVPLFKAGADRCVVGSAILSQNDPEHAYRALVSLAQKAHVQESL